MSGPSKCLGMGCGIATLCSRHGEEYNPRVWSAHRFCRYGYNLVGGFPFFLAKDGVEQT